MATLVDSLQSVFKLNDAGGVLRNLTPYITAIEGLPEERELSEVAALGSEGEQFIPGLQDITFSVEGIADTVADISPDAILGPLLTSGAVVPFYYGPKGSAAGAVRYTGDCWLYRYESEPEVGETVRFFAEFVVHGTVTRDTWPSELTLYERYETGTNNSTGGYSTIGYGGQTFTPAIAHSITKVGVFGWKQGNPVGDGFIDVYNVNQVTHLPTGARLARATYETSDIPGAPVWIETDLDIAVDLLVGTEYALVFSQPSSPDSANSVILRSDTPTPTYAGGVMLFSNTGFANLAAYPTYDYQFREYGNPI